MVAATAALSALRYPAPTGRVARDALWSITPRSSAAVIRGLIEAIKAATPATIGDAIDVPDLYS